MKKDTSKLMFKRETVRTLTPDELHHMAGGQPPRDTETQNTYVRSSYPMYCCRNTQYTTGGN